MAVLEKDLNLLDSLIANDAIQLHVEAKNWKDAVVKAINPLVRSKAVEARYSQAVIASTIEFGPYYIIGDNIAMPHARPEDGVNKSAFSLVVLKAPVWFDNDPRAIKIIIAFAAASAAIHVGVALPQVVASFEEPATINKILIAKTSDEVVSILQAVDYTKYVS